MKKYYDGHNLEVWKATPYPFDLEFEEKMELYKKESKQKIRELEMKQHTKRERKGKKEENAKRRKIASKKRF